MKTIMTDWLKQRRSGMMYKTVWQQLHIDPTLMISLIILIAAGLIILYSASNQNMDVITKQLTRIGMALVIMFAFAQISPQRYQYFAPWLYVIAVILLIAVLATGHIGKGAQRWLNLGLFRFQPSEVMKIALPLMLAWYLHIHPLPPTKIYLAIAAILIGVPVLLTAKQPDLSTAILISSAGAYVLFLAGMSWWLIISSIVLISGSLPFLWHFLHDYQRERVLTFFDPERDPLGSGYHIIQSKIAIGSGGLFGKGWLHGTQSHLQFLPEHTTDFIFAVCGEEFGLVGGLLLLLIYLAIIARGLYISVQAQDTFSRLLAGSITLMFFTSVYINMVMVTGVLPVVGIPLPLVSYGGTSVVTVLASFGILMSIATHRKLVRT